MLNGLVVHVRAKPCGARAVWAVERAKDRRGYDKRSPRLVGGYSGYETAA